MSTALTPAAFTLLKELERNNDREWYAERRGDFKRELLDPFETILTAITERLARTAMPIIGSKKTIVTLTRQARSLIEFGRDAR